MTVRDNRDRAVEVGVRCSVVRVRVRVRGLLVSSPIMSLISAMREFSALWSALGQGEPWA